VRQIASLALPAFLASAASTQSLQAAILPSHFSQVDSVFQSFKDRWLTIFGPVPIGDSSHTQSAWDRPGLQAARDSVESSKSDPWQKAAFLASAARNSGDWLSALPIESCGLRLDDEAVRVAVALWLGLGLCATYRLPVGVGHR